jgi:glycosyltransferase involved in cell wall biosynthesis
VRLLIVGINYAPEETGIAPYTTGMARHFSSRGHDVRVLTGVPHYPSWRADQHYRRGIWWSECDGDIRLRRARHYVPARQSAARRGAYEASFLLSGLGGLGRERPDAIIGVVPSLSGGVLARLASRRFGAPYGLLFQDLMGRAAAESGVEGARGVAGAVRAAEAWSARGASAVAVIAAGFRPYVESLGVAPQAVFRVRNWVHIAEPDAPAAETRQRFGLPEDAFIALHAGNMGYKQGLENVIECARRARDAAAGVLFVLMGDGNRRAVLEQLAAQHALDNVRFLPIQPEHEFSNLLASADVLLVNQAGSVTDMSLPGKLTSYFFAGKPVVAAVADLSETAAEVRAAGAGVLVRPDDPAALLRALLELAGQPERSTQLGEAARAYAHANLTAEASLRDYEAFVAAVAGASGGKADRIRGRVAA